MTIASTDRAATRIPRAPLFGVARYETPGGPVDFEIGWDELERDTEWATGFLAEYGIAHDRYVIVVSATPLAPWARPFEIAIRNLGAVICPTDAYSFDARRVVMFAQGRPPKTMILGLEEQVTAGLEQFDGGIAGTIGHIPYVLARPAVHDTLRAAGIEPYGFMPLGPALAVECQARGGMHVNAGEWAVEAVEGELHLTTVAPRAHRVERERTGVRGTVVTEPCTCGRTDPRIVLEAAGS
jgi:hypothetical protein